jgi:hypothetical protein
LANKAAAIEDLTVADFNRLFAVNMRAAYSLPRCHSINAARRSPVHPSASGKSCRHKNP